MTNGTHLRAPAITALKDHQEQLVADLRSGFDDHIEVMLWTHDVAVNSLGYIDNEFAARTAAQPWESAALLSGYARRDRVTDHPPTDDEAAHRRERLREEHLMPAFREAIGHLRRVAEDRTHDPEPAESVEAASQPPGLRPLLGDIASDQRTVLEWALGVADDKRSIEGLSSVNDWLEQVHYATRGFAPEDFGRRVRNPVGRWWFALLDTATPTLVTRLSNDLYPSMNRALTDALDRSQEQARKGHTAGRMSMEAGQ